jgi:hypothetical protein
VLHFFGALFAAVLSLAPAPAAAQTVTPSEAGTWLRANGPAALSNMSFSHAQITVFEADADNCTFGWYATNDPNDPNSGVQFAVDGSFRTAMTALNGAVVQFYTPNAHALAEYSSSGSSTRNLYIIPVGVRDRARAEQFVRMFNIVSAACGGPGR